MSVLGTWTAFRVRSRTQGALELEMDQVKISYMVSAPIVEDVFWCEIKLSDTGLKFGV